MRDYDEEHKDNSGRKYAYGFDFDVMHGYMIDAFLPFKRPGGVLELGSFKGAFTKRLASHFTDIVGVEASSEAITEATRVLGSKGKIYPRSVRNITVGAAVSQYRNDACA